MLNFLNKRSILIIALAYSFIILIKSDWANAKTPIKHDVAGYYVYLPAIFIHHDISLSYIDAEPKQFTEEGERYFATPSPSGKGYVNIYTPGQSILCLPFFFIGHLTAIIFHYPVTGYSMPYKLLLIISSFFYSLLGLFWLKKILLTFFNRKSALITLFTVALGSNLLFYSTINAGMTHAYLFAIFSMVLYYTIQWHQTHKIYQIIIVASGCGLATMIRPSDVLICLIPVLYGVSSFQSLKIQLENFWNYKSQIILFLVFFILAMAPLFLYWKITTGNYIYYSYQGMGFYFDNPKQIIQGLIGFRKGWLIYTPMMIFSIAGLFLLKKQTEKFTCLLMVFIPLNIYFILSWWCWWYGGSLGQRSMIDSYALLSIPFAAFINYLFLINKQIRLMFFSLMSFFVFLNIFQSYQYTKGILNGDSMTAKAYQFIFAKPSLSKNEKLKLYTLIEPPDYSKKGNPRVD